METSDSIRPLSVLFLVRSLEVGGAERQLVQLARGLHQRGHLVRVAVFYRKGAFEADLERAGIEIIDLAKSGRWEIAPFLLRTMTMIRKVRPDVVYSFLGGANIVAAIAKLASPRTPLAWSSRSSSADARKYEPLYSVTHRLERALGLAADVVISNSFAGRDFCIGRGFSPRKIEVVPNGIDTDQFRPDATARSEQRRRWGLTDDDVAVGVLARLVPIKDHRTFLEAAAIVARQRGDFRFFCIGEGPSEATLRRFVRDLGIEQRVVFTGPADPVAALNGLDIACSTSLSEGFSNSVAEAAACGLPCVVTDVGDSRAIVGDTGIVVPPGEPGELAAALLGIAEDFGKRPSPGRSRIEENFSVPVMVRKTEALLARVAAGGSSPSGKGAGGGTSRSAV